MDTIRDSDLILYHYRDGLDAETLAAIERALQQSPALQQRYATLRATLEAADAQPLPQPDAGFDERLWQRLEARLDAESASTHTPREPHRRVTAAARRDTATAMPRRSWLRPAASALALAAALGLGFFLGRQPAQPPDPTPRIATTTAAGDPAAAPEKLSARVLDAYVAAHLRETEGVVLTAVNSGNADLLAGNRELAASLIDSNRLYAQAAQRAGNARLANFLQQLEPLLIELANPPPADPIQGSEGLRDYVDKSDVLFQLRAIQARMQAPRSTST